MKIVHLSPPGFQPLKPMPGSPNYQLRHPTRYTWRPAVANVVKHIRRKWNVSVNTYFDHPEDFGRTIDSLDVWGPAGRNDPLSRDTGDKIKHWLFNVQPRPIDWIIWEAQWWLQSRGTWQPFGTDPFTWHFDHVHCTFMR